MISGDHPAYAQSLSPKLNNGALDRIHTYIYIYKLGIYRSPAVNSSISRVPQLHGGSSYLTLALCLYCHSLVTGLGRVFNIITMQFSLFSLAAVLSTVSATVVHLPLRSRAREHAALGGDARFRLPSERRAANSSGVNVPVTDWFNRTDNQVYFQEVKSTFATALAETLLLVVHHIRCWHSASESVRHLVRL